MGAHVNEVQVGQGGMVGSPYSLPLLFFLKLTAPWQLVTDFPFSTGASFNLTSEATHW